MKAKHIIMVILTALFASCSPKETTITILETTDTHGRYDEFANDALIIKQMKSELGDKLILLDNGDNMQGSVFQYCSNQNPD